MVKTWSNYRQGSWSSVSTSVTPARADSCGTNWPHVFCTQNFIWRPSDELEIAGKFQTAEWIWKNRSNQIRVCAAGCVGNTCAEVCACVCQPGSGHMGRSVFVQQWHNEQCPKHTKSFNLNYWQWRLAGNTRGYYMHSSPNPPTHRSSLDFIILTI